MAAARYRRAPCLGFMHLLADDEQSLAVGDWCLLCGTNENGYSVIARMPALTHLARRNNEGKLQSLASNIDTALLVMGLDNDFNLRRLEALFGASACR